LYLEQKVSELQFQIQQEQLEKERIGFDLLNQKRSTLEKNSKEAENAILYENLSNK